MSDRFPRRSAIDRLCRIAAMPFGVSLFGVATPRPTPPRGPARAKVAPALVAYVDIAVGGAKHCSACEHFVPGRAATANGTCTRVLGAIAPTGHCAIWAPRDHD
jgi:hypothetical protein